MITKYNYKFLEYGIYYEPATNRKKRLVKAFITQEAALQYLKRKNDSLSTFVKMLGAKYSLKKLSQREIDKIGKEVK